jgi:hypothetical protein
VNLPLGIMFERVPAHFAGALGARFARLYSTVILAARAQISSTDECLQLKNRYPSPLKRSVHVGGPLLSFPRTFPAMACPLVAISDCNARPFGRLEGPSHV